MVGAGGVGAISLNSGGISYGPPPSSKSNNDQAIRLGGYCHLLEWMSETRFIFIFQLIKQSNISDSLPLFRIQFQSFSIINLPTFHGQNFIFNLCLNIVFSLPHSPKPGLQELQESGFCPKVGPGTSIQYRWMVGFNSYNSLYRPRFYRIFF